MAEGTDDPIPYIAAEGYGKVHLRVIRLGYGMSIVSSESETARHRTFYPRVRTSGTWYIETMWPNRKTFVMFQQWMMSYISRIANPSLVPPPPLEVSVPSRKFLKTGFPSSAVEVFDRVDMAGYPMRVEFSSASDLLDASEASRYNAPRIGVGNVFYPAGYQSNSALVDAVNPFANYSNDEVTQFHTGTGGLFRR